MGRLTTHVLDTALGRPAAGLTIELYRVGKSEEPLAVATTNGDGRLDRPLLEGGGFVAGSYELRFHAGDYLRGAGEAARAAVPRRDPDPLRHRLGGRALPCAAPPLALWLFAPIAEADACARRIRFIRKGRMVETRRRRADDDASRLSPRGRGRQRHQGRMRRRRLRRLHGGARQAPRRAPRLRAGERLHPAPRPGRRRRGQSRSRISPRNRRHAPPGPGGDGRATRLAMRLLHAGLRDEPLHALSSTDGTVGRATRSNDWIAGNLCRCTGYRPIVDAAHCRLLAAAPRPLRASTPATPPACSPFSPTAKTSSSATKTASSPRPRSIDSLADLYERNPDATIVAGATDVGLWITKQMRDLHKIILIGRVRGFDHIEDTGYELIDRRGATYTTGGAALPGDRSRTSASSSAASARSRYGPRARSAATSPTARRSATRRRR